MGNKWLNSPCPWAGCASAQQREKQEPAGHHGGDQGTFSISFSHLGKARSIAMHLTWEPCRRTLGTPDSSRAALPAPPLPRHPFCSPAHPGGSAHLSAVHPRLQATEVSKPGTAEPRCVAPWEADTGLTRRLDPGPVGFRARPPQDRERPGGTCGLLAPRPGFAPPAAPRGGGAQPLPRPRARPGGGGTAPPRVPGPRGKGDEAGGRVPGEGAGAGPARTARGPLGTRSAEPRGDADTDALADPQPGRGAHSPARAARGRQAPRAASSSSSSSSAPRRAATILQRRGRGRGAAGGGAGLSGAGRGGAPPPRGGAGSVPPAAGLGRAAPLSGRRPRGSERRGSAGRSAGRGAAWRGRAPRFHHSLSEMRSARGRRRRVGRRCRARRVPGAEPGSRAEAKAAGVGIKFLPWPLRNHMKGGQGVVRSRAWG